MKQFFLKKKVYTVLFLACLFSLFAWNILANQTTYKGYVKNLQTLRTYEDLKNWMENAETVFQFHLPGKQVTTELYSLTQKLLGKREFHNFQYIVDKDGVVYYGSVFQRGGEDLEQYANRVKALSNFTILHDTKFMFVMAPCKVISGVSTVDRKLMINDPNPRMDMLLSQLQQRGVHALDLRLAMQQSGETLLDLFYASDHYWTGKGAFYGAKAFLQDMEAYYGETLDSTGYYRNLENYEEKVYPEIVLGSSGKLLGKTYCGMEDFIQYLPKNYQEYTYTWESKRDGIFRQGNLKDALYMEEALTPQDIYNDNVYHVYLNQSNQQDSIINHNCPDGLRIGVLRDSYFSPMAIYLAPMVNRMDLYRNDDPSAVEELLQGIENHQYDYVIYETYPYNLEEENFPFFETNTTRKTVSANTNGDLHEK